MRLKHLLTATILGVVALIGLGAIGTIAHADRGVVSPVFWFEDLTHPQGELVPGGSSSLRRSAMALTAHISSSQLNPGHAYTMWWVVFNNPDGCAGGPEACGGPDVEAALMTGVNSAEVGVLYAGGRLVGNNGQFNAGAQLMVGSTAGCQTDNLFAGVCTPLSNPEGAVVVLVLHDHGPPTPGKVQEMTGSFEGGCESYIIGNTGFLVEVYGLGDYECYSPQASVHTP